MIVEELCRTIVEGVRTRCDNLGTRLRDARVTAAIITGHVTLTVSDPDFGELAIASFDADGIEPRIVEAIRYRISRDLGCIDRDSVTVPYAG